GEKILVAEDDAEVRALAIELLTGLGYDITEAGSAEEALELINDAAPIDLLLTDVVLPGAMSGPDLATEILRRSPAIKKLYMTGYAEAAFSSQHELDSETPVLQKPFKMAELAATIRGVLDGP
ncbi:MAG TPA: response regulator, partial [Alphaproteobacteria bacterium]|nr:response regulator [Alphaproteobacteria bacterium]